MSIHVAAPSAPAPETWPLDSDVAERVRIPEARDIILAELAASRALTETLNILIHSGGHPMLFAGAVRDALEVIETGRQYSAPRDFDIGVVGLGREVFDEVLRDRGASINRFGGYRLLTGDSPPLDVWRLEETLGVRLNQAPLTVGNVLRSFVISLNAVAFDPISAIFYDCGALASMRSRRLDFVRGCLLHSYQTFAAKAALSSIRFSMDLQPELMRFSLTHGEESALLHETQKAFPGLPLPGHDPFSSSSRHDALSVD